MPMSSKQRLGNCGRRTGDTRCDSSAALTTNWRRGCATSARAATTACIRSIICCMAASCTKGQVQAWALNRYYYQAMIPIKDATLIARCDDPDLRRNWRSRLVDHDGESGAQEGGIERWLRLTDGLGLDRDYVASERGLLPATRFAVDAYVHFVREKSLLEAVASSPHRDVLAGDHQRAASKACCKTTTSSAAIRSPISSSGRRRPQRDSDFALDYVKQQRQDARGAASRCSRRSNSNATCCGLCSMRCITPMSSPDIFRPAPSCRKTEACA